MAQTELRGAGSSCLEGIRRVDGKFDQHESSSQRDGPVFSWGDYGYEDNAQGEAGTYLIVLTKPRVGHGVVLHAPLIVE